MQVSAIAGTTHSKRLDSYGKQRSDENSATFTSSFEKELLANMLEWKSFCQKQILNNNLDYIA